MFKTHPQKEKCHCGSGKPRHSCCASGSGGRVIHFSAGKRHNYRGLLARINAELVEYARIHYYNWEPFARAKFTTGAKVHELNDVLNPYFWNWFTINYRFQHDVSPIIDFYLSENEDYLDAQAKLLTTALRDSCLAVYEVLWIQDHAMAVRDIFNHQDYVVENDLKVVDIEPGAGMLMLARLVFLDNTVLMLEKPVYIMPEHRDYVCQELESALSLEEGSSTAELLRTKPEILSSILVNYSHGIQKNRIKSRTLMINEGEYPRLIQRLLKSGEFSFLERSEHWVKFTWPGEHTGFSRVYANCRHLILVSENHEELSYISRLLITKLESMGITGSWQDGCSMGSAEEGEEEEFLLEIMHDQYLEDWLSAPLPELNNMSPLQAASDGRGRLLLANLLNQWEALELRAHSKGEYFLPLSMVKSKLNFDKAVDEKEMLQPEAIAIQVSSYRNRQRLASYICSYQWTSEDYEKIAAEAFDRFRTGLLDIESMSWILYMWNEFSSIYRPKVGKSRGWLAAMEYTYWQIRGARCGYSKIARNYGLPIWMLSFKVQLMARHFKSYPLNLDAHLISYPRWEEMSAAGKMKTYDEVKQHLNLYLYTARNNYQWNEKAAQDSFYETLDTSGRFWPGKTNDIFKHFYKDYAVLDHADEKGSTLANLFWDDYACRFPSHFKEAAFNLMISRIGAYYVDVGPGKRVFFEDVFTGQRCEALGNFSSAVEEEITDDTIIITRLLPVDGKQWIRDPFYVLMAENREHFKSQFEMLMEKMHSGDEGDFQYLKQRGKFLVKAYIMALQAMEQETLQAIKQPLHLHWWQAEIGDQIRIEEMLERSQKFQVLSASSRYQSYLWTSFGSPGRHQWGYVLLGRDGLLVFCPPGKDLPRLLKDIRYALRRADIVVNFKELQSSLPVSKELEKQLVNDLARYLNSNPERSLMLLRQDVLGNEEKEYEQGVFLLKLGSMLIEHLADLG